MIKQLTFVTHKSDSQLHRRTSCEIRTHVIIISLQSKSYSQLHHRTLCEIRIHAIIMSLSST
jgi:hypothetical protein